MKILLSITPWFPLALGLALIGLTCSIKPMPKPSNPSNPDIFQTDLQEFYSRLNDGFMDGQLPLDTRVIYGIPPSDVARVLGETGQTNSGQFIIWINPKYNIDLSTGKATMIHETCHVATWRKDMDLDGHGPLWRKCMHRMADLGAFEGVW